MSKQIQIDAQARADALVADLSTGQLTINLVTRSDNYAITRLTAKFDLVNGGGRVKLPDVWITPRGGEVTTTAVVSRRSERFPTAEAWDRLLAKVKEGWPAYKTQANELITASREQSQRVQLEAELRAEVELAFMTLGIKPPRVETSALGHTLEALHRLQRLTLPKVKHTRVELFRFEFNAVKYYSSMGVSEDEIARRIAANEIHIDPNPCDRVGRWISNEPLFDQWTITFKGE